MASNPFLHCFRVIKQIKQMTASNTLPTVAPMTVLVFADLDLSVCILVLGVGEGLEVVEVVDGIDTTAVGDSSD